MQSTKVWRETLSRGLSIGEYSRLAAGTVGPIVRTPDGGYALITCSHVVGAVGTMVVQPSEADTFSGNESEIIGSVLKNVFHPVELEQSFRPNSNILGVDAALVKLKDSKLVDPTGFPLISATELSQLGLTLEQLTCLDGLTASPEEAMNQIVIKYGGETGLRMGKVIDLKEHKLFHEEHKQLYTMPAQYSVERHGPNAFAEQGDSGAAVYMINVEKQLALIGIVTGVCGADRNYQTVVTPIERIINAFQLGPSAFKYDEPMEFN